MRIEDTADPHPANQWGIAALDLNNTFGNVQGAYTLETAMRSCPAVAPMLAAMWSSGVAHLHVAQITGRWAAMPTYGSLLQGGLEGHPMFCVVLWAAIGARIQARQGQSKVWLYIDDIVAQAPEPELPHVIRATGEGATQGLGGTCKPRSQPSTYRA